MLPDYLLRNLTLVKPAVTNDRWNDGSRDYGDAATRSTIRGYTQRSSGSDQTTDDRSPVIGEWLLITNAANIDAYDQVEADGATYMVDGPPWPVWRGGAGIHHYEVNLKTVEG